MNVRIWESLTKAELCRLNNEVRVSPMLPLLWRVPGLQWSASIKSSPRKEMGWTRDRDMGSQGSLMYTGNKSWPIWSDPTSTKVYIEYTVHHSLLRMGLNRCRPVRLPILTPVHCPKCQQWASEHRNWTPAQWKKIGLIWWITCTSHGWLGVCCLLCWRKQAVWCFGRCSAGKPSSLWMLLQLVPPS